MPHRLTVTSGPDKGAFLDFSVDPVILGRDPACNFVLRKDTATSHIHAEIQPRDDGKILFRDLSKHGSWLNGERVKEHALRDGDEIRIGNNHIRFDLGGESAKLPIPLPGEGE